MRGGVWRDKYVTGTGVRSLEGGGEE